jgi:DNA-binding response OmpR family regulator
MGIRVAVVDDELFFREAITEVLESAGIDCVTAQDGEEALLLAAEPDVGVMLLDIRMPGMDGIEVLRRLREQRPGLCVLVLSASTDQETVLEALRLGASDYLAKPLHDEELVFAVRRAVESHALKADSERLRARLGRLVSLTEELSQAASCMSGAARREFLCRAAADGAAELLQARRSSLLLRDEGSGDPDGLGEPWQLRVVAAVGNTESIDELSPVIIGEGVAGGVAERGEALLVTARSQDDRFDTEPIPGRYTSDSFVVVPLFLRADSGSSLPGTGADPGTSLADAVLSEGEAHEQALGVLCATEPEHGAAFGAEDLALLRLLAGRLAELISTPRDTKDAVPEAARRGESDPLDSLTTPLVVAGSNDRDAELVRGICDALANEVEPQRVLRAVLEPLERDLRAAPVSLYLVDAGSGELVCEAQLDGGIGADRKTLPANRGLTGTVFQSGNLVATQSPDLDSRYDPDVDTPEDGSVGPLLCVPLRLRGKVIGVCRAFLPGDVTASPRTGEVLAAALSAAVRNVLLYRSLVESIEEVAEARRQARL